MRKKKKYQQRTEPRNNAFGEKNAMKTYKEGIGVWGITVGDYEYYVQFLGRKSMIGPSIKRHFKRDDYTVDKFIPSGTHRLIIDIDKNYDLEYKLWD